MLSTSFEATFKATVFLKKPDKNLEELQDENDVTLIATGKVMLDIVYISV